MSFRLILEEYLGMMKESGELDSFLPELLTAMDHEILSEPQRGVRQFGVDMVSRGPGDSGAASLHLWVLKGGDIDRAVWSAGNQSIRNALIEIEDVYLKTHVLPIDAGLPKVVHVLTNGEFKQEVEIDIAQYCHSFSSRTGVQTQKNNGSVLASWTEQYLFDEYVLPPKHRSLLRKSLAMVESPDICYQNARELINQLLADSLEGSSAARLRAKLRSIRAVLVANRILIQWATAAGNLEGAYRVCEFAVLRTWCFVRQSDLESDPVAGNTFANIFNDYLGTATAYCEKLEPFYTTENAFAAIYRENLLVADRVFEELGRLGLLTCAYRFFMGGEAAVENARALAGRIAALIGSHSVSGSPCFDRQSTDISLAMLGLIAGERPDVAKSWLEILIKRLGFAKRAGRYAPIAGDSFEDLVAVRNGEEPATMISPYGTSTVVPILAIWCVFFEADTAWEHLADIVAPAYSGTTFNLWIPDENYESILADGAAIDASGYAEAFLELPKDRSIFDAMLRQPVPGVVSIATLGFVARGWPWLSLLASRHWKLQAAHSIVELLAHAMSQRLEAAQ